MTQGLPEMSISSRGGWLFSSKVLLSL